jgi:sulfite exporter TauE/SafE/copper chaperone CopZ
MSRTYIWRVHGMHCASCERVIEQAFAKLPGIEEVEASLRQQRIGIRVHNTAPEPDISAIKTELAPLGYRFELDSKAPNESKPVLTDCALPGIAVKAPFRQRLFKSAIAIAAVGILAAILLPVFRSIIPSVSAGASFGALFAFGVIASISTCLASTGGFLLAYTSEAPGIRNVIGVHIGRFAGFVIGGSVLGFIGSAIPSISTSAYGILALALGIAFLIIGLHHLDLAPSLASLGLRIPKRISGLADRIRVSQHPFASIGVGMATFILPCGFTQTAQALALASGSPIRGALIMGAFALGTLPVLAGISSVGRLASLKHPVFRLTVGAILVVFSFGQINGGLTVLGAPLTPGSIAANAVQAFATPSAIADPGDKEQVVRMTVANGTYQPKNLTIKAGIPVRWEIDGQDVSGCARDIIVPSLKIKKTLVRGKNVITFTPTKPGTIPFSCGMGMIRGSFTVTSAS